MAKKIVILGLAVLATCFGILLVNRESVPELYGGVEELLDEMFADPEFSSAALGFCLIDDAGELVVGRHEAVAFIPASSLKTLTGATALEILGADFRFETRLLAQGAIAGSGVLSGDLVVVGGGDPTLHVSDLTGWVEELKSAGLRRIAGGVVADGTLFPESIAGDFWNWGDVGNGYGSPVAGLNLNHNRFTARFRAGTQIGQEATFLGAEPLVPGVEWVNRVATGAAGSGDQVNIYGGPGATRLVMRGTVPPSDGGEVFGVSGAVPDPALFAAHAFDRQLRAAGISVGEVPRVLAFGAVGAEEGETLLVHRSAPLIEIVRHLNEVSDNHESECLFRLLGVRAGRPPEVVLVEHWRARGLDLSGCRIVDGSGLSRANFISSEDLARLQYLARRGPCGEDYYRSLNSYFKGAVRWKGGAMSSVRSYTGYVTGSSGREYTFALMFNHYLDGEVVNAWRDRLVRALLAL